MTDHSAHHAGGAQVAPRNRFEADMNAGMGRMMDDMHSPGFTGNPDMARLVLIHGRDPLVRQLAEEIIASQTVEIAGMRGRMAVLLKGPNPAPGGYPALGSLRGG
jgi:hypothetical protein